MIAFPSSVRVWLAVGRTDMRRGMQGLALQVQEAMGRDPHAGDLYVFRGARGDLIRSFGTTASACRFIQSVSRKGVLYGPRRRTGSWLSRRLRSAICSTESTGEIRVTPGAQRVLDNIWWRNFIAVNEQYL